MYRANLTKFSLDKKGIKEPVHPRDGMVLATSNAKACRLHIAAVSLIWRNQVMFTCNSVYQIQSRITQKASCLMFWDKAQVVDNWHTNVNNIQLFRPLLCSIYRKESKLRKETTEYRRYFVWKLGTGRNLSSQYSLRFTKVGNIFVFF